MILPDPKLRIEDQEITTLLSMLIWGEARGESISGKAAVANVVLNRVLTGRYPGGKDWRRVMLAPFQFSCFLISDVNRNKLLEPTKHDSPEVWESCYSIANTILNGGGGIDNTQRATHYHSFPDANDSRAGWTKAFIHTVDYGKLHFFRDPYAFKIEHQEPAPVVA